MRIYPAAWPAEPVEMSRALTKSVRRPIAKGNRGPYLNPVERHSLPDQEDAAAVAAWVRQATGPTAVDLFCGAGGLSLGLQDAGFSVLLGADSDPASVESHSANLGSLGYCGDLADYRSFLRKARSWGIDRVDLVAGGVPCQPFSRAGRSKIRSLVEEGRRPAIDPRAGLWRSFVEIVRGLRPRAVLLENVPDLTVWNDGAILAGICQALNRLGYTTDAMLLNAYDYGVPQHRARLVVVATRPGLKFEWPAASDRTTVRDAIGDLPPVPPAQLDDRITYGGASTLLQRQLRRGVPEDESGWIFDHVTRDVRPDDAEAFALMSEGGIYADLPLRLQRYRSDIFDDKYKRLTWNGLSRSITAHVAKDGYWYIHPDQNRTLSVRETARIQTFPDWFRFAGHRTAQFRQIGNAVPPLLAEAVGRQLRITLSVPTRRGRRTGPLLSFRSALEQWHASHQRAVPWRTSGNPWAVLLAECSLSRSPLSRASLIYPLALELAPTPQSLTEPGSTAQDGLRALGLKQAVNELTAIADAVVDLHGGTLPTTEAALLSLPHVGEYLASAVLVYGQDQATVILDRKAARVARRLRGSDLQPGHWQSRLDLQQLSGYAGPDRAFNSSVSDLADLLCRPSNPLCPECPVRRYCATGLSQLDSVTPRRHRTRTQLAVSPT